MSPHNPAPRAHRRTESYREKQAQARTPAEKLKAAYDYLRAAMAISGREDVEREVSIAVTHIVESADRLLAWRTE